jgi:microcystin-dependent protein
MSNIDVSDFNLINTTNNFQYLTMASLNVTSVTTTNLIVSTSTIGSLVTTDITTTNLKSTNTTTNTCTITSLVATGITAGTLNTGNFVGMIGSFGATTVPTGWLYCNGSAVSRATYSALFSVIGTTWGVGDGTTTFNVPDLRGAFLRGYGAGTINGRSKAGPSVGSRQEDLLQGHRHIFHGMNWTSSQSYHNVIFLRQKETFTTYRSTRVNDMSAPLDNESGTYGTPRVGAETYPYNAGVNYCIKF